LKKLIKHIILIVVLALLCLSEWYLPTFLWYFPQFQTDQLGGSFERIDEPQFYPQIWLSRRFQRNFERFQKRQGENAPFFIKVRNQLNYEIFRNLAATDIILGQDDILHSKDYCTAYIGDRCCNEALLQGKADTLRMLNDWLETKGKKLLVLLPPGKGRVMPGNMPEFYHRNVTTETNWEKMRQYLRDVQVPVMDFQFLIDQHQSGSSLYSLYPQLGLHWSYYGLTVAADSMRSKISKMLSVELPVMHYDEVNLDTILEKTDEELLFGANLFYDLPKKAMPYPVIHYQQQDGSYQPNVLILGDSYYETFLNYGIHKGLFDEDSSLWYYYSTALPQGGNARYLDLSNEINRRDLIIIQAGELNIPNLGFGFLEKVYPLMEQD
jgi:hypothetical protein